MIRVLVGLTIGIYFGLKAPNYIRQCLEMRDRHFEALHKAFHKEAHEKGK